jgi:hypothetical protein
MLRLFSRSVLHNSQRQIALASAHTPLDVGVVPRLVSAHTPLDVGVVEIRGNAGKVKAFLQGITTQHMEFAPMHSLVLWCLR